MFHAQLVGASQQAGKDEQAGGIRGRSLPEASGGVGNDYSAMGDGSARGVLHGSRNAPNIGLRPAGQCDEMNWGQNSGQATIRDESHATS